MTTDAHYTRVCFDHRGGVWLTFAGEEYGPPMRSVEDAQAFLGVWHDRTGLDARHADERRLAAAYAKWREAGATQ